MVNVQFGDDGQHRVNDVGAVQPAAQAHFNHGKVYGFGLKMHKGRGGDGFKEGGFKVDALGGSRNYGDDIPKGRLFDFHSAN